MTPRRIDCLGVMAFHSIRFGSAYRHVALLNGIAASASRFRRLLPRRGHMKRLGAALVLAVLGLAGCGGGGASSGVDGTKQISAVNDTEKGTLCDWFVSKVGPYGSTPACEEAPLEPPPSRAECISDFPTCMVPVSVFEACVNTLVAAQATCTQQSLAAVLADPNCQMVGAAGCFGGGSGSSGGGGGTNN
jgi:hypothetical protein